MKAINTICLMLFLSVLMTSCSEEAGKKRALAREGFAVSEQGLLQYIADGDVVAVEMLLQARIKPNVFSQSDNTSGLEMAVERASPEIAKLLLEYGADPLDEARKGRAIIAAIEKGFFEVVKLIVEKGYDVNEKDHAGQPILSAAVTSKHSDTVEFLLAFGADPNILDAEGYTPLMLAAKYSNETSWQASNKTIRLLLDHGADLKTLKSGRPDEGVTALQLARHWETEEFIKAGGKEVYDEAKLLRYLRDGDADGIGRALNAGVDANVRDKYGLTAFTVAVYAGDRQIAELLKKAGGTGELSIDRFQGLVKDDNFEAVRLMIEEGIDVNAENRARDLALHDASRRGQLEMAEILLDAGAAINQQDYHGDTPLNLAVGKLEMLSFLLQRGADVNRPNVIGWTSLISASRANLTDAVEMLISHGADLEARTSPDHGVISGGTALMIAIGHGSLEAVGLLIDRGADVNTKDADGATPLMAAAYRGRTEMIGLLLQAGADVNARTDPDHGNMTALQSARLRYPPVDDLIEMLKKFGAKD